MREMPGMDGMEVFQRIHNLPQKWATNLPVFLTTADTERTRIQACLAAGIKGVIPKPIRKAKLAALLSNMAALGEGTPDPEPECDLVDQAHVDQVLADLGLETWRAGLRACRASAAACLDELENPSSVDKALHRLAGLSANYGMLRLHQTVRRAQVSCASGSSCPKDELRSLVEASLAYLETISNK
jgi:response regulator RpfG family c-di-GMP phosphodiesterase